MSMGRRPSHIPEHLLARLWRNRDWRRRSLLLAGGRRLRVLYPGRPGGGPGPDFRDALLQVDGGPAVRGDVEIHIEPRGWREHGHHRDPRYNDVVLHVVAVAPTGGLTRREDGEEVPVVGLVQQGKQFETEPSAKHAGLSSLRRIEAKGPPRQGTDSPALPLLRRWRALSEGALCRLLDRAGRERFLEKSARFQALLREQDGDQLLYSGTLEALGYSRNREPFLELARRLPWSALRRLGLEASPDERVSRLEELLLEVAGLRPGGSLHEDWSSAQPPLIWCFAGLTPAKQPHRRIAGAARLLGRYIESGLLPTLQPTVTGGKFAEVRRAFTVVDGWTLVGRQRAADIVVNVALPLLHANAVAEGDTAMAMACLRLAKGAPRLEENEITREMAALLQLPTRVITVGAYRQQGLIHLYRSLLRQGVSSEGRSPLLKERRSLYRGLLRQGVSSEGRSPLLKERRSSYYMRGAPRSLS